MSQSICILNSYGRVLNLKVNTTKHGYNQLKYYFNDNKDDIQTILIDNPYIELERLNIGKYIIYAYNSRNNISSEELEIYIPGNSYQDRVDKLWTLARIEENEYNNTLKKSLLKQLRHNPEQSLLYFLYTKLSAIEDPEEFERELFFKLIVIQEKFENLESSNYNRTNNGFNLFKNNPVPKLIMSDAADTLKIYKIIDGEKRLFKIYRNISEETDLYFDEDNFYEIQVLNNTDLIVTFKHVHFDYDNMLLLWKTVDEFLEEYDDITQDIVSISSNVTMNSTELKNYLLERNMFPINNIMPRLTVNYTKYVRPIDITIDNVSYTSISDHKFYLSGKDIEFIDEDVDNRFIEIGGEYNTYDVNFNPISNMIDREAILFITDENGTIVSKPTRALFTEENEDYYEYYEKIRQHELNSYMDNLIKYISTSCPQYYDSIQEIYSSLFEDETVNADNILENIFDALVSTNNSNNDKLFYEILKNHFVNTNYDSQFFSDKGFIFERYTSKVITEESEDGYVLCIIAKELGDSKFNKYYIHSFKDRAIELNLNNFGKYIIYAISEKDYKYSGFFYLNTNSNFFKSYLLNQGVR